MAKDEVTQNLVDEIAPTELKTFADAEQLLTLEEIFPGQAAIQTSLKEKGIARTSTKNGQEMFIAADLDSDGRVVAMAAAISRTPTRADKYLQDSVQDLSKTKDMSRYKTIALCREI